MTEAAVTTITLAEICKELDMKPQSARVKLRKKLPEAKGDGFRWSFPIEQKESIIAILKPAKKAEGSDE